MKDEHGLYYYPVPHNKRIKMYVRSREGVVEFRLHNQDDPGLWLEHGWITYEAARQAAELYRGSGRSNPLNLYDFEVALRILIDEEAAQG